MESVSSIPLGLIGEGSQNLEENYLTVAEWLQNVGEGEILPVSAVLHGDLDSII